ncbi:ankyrin repeat domain-containing protein [Anaerosacchariphilus polymeriproducens]|uniref:Ankyrin repeat domain-containing protein n=1 Tax=Anaerosacchariphilus polymeriproducens TaxID=1812858 RepID=A0A371ARL7_9FIRM|nr:ankyrin repeat domain-containing protein [Anaerosacchariphilus polymeriproducens]RDU22221.1 ankyrin repeat domain-containing protein [Anaerosacchariphilus polymeriproducens]
MDLIKADYNTVIKFGNKEDLLSKIEMENKTISDIINIPDKNGVSLLEKALISRKFEIAQFLLDCGAEVNIVSIEGCNEFHYIAANINSVGAVDVAYELLDKGVDLSKKEKKFGNTALFTLCQEVLKRRSTEGIKFICKCLQSKPNVDENNKLGYNVRKILEERGTDEMKNLLEEI